MSTSPLAIGLIGFGKFSRFLVSSLAELPTVQIRKVYDPKIISARPPELPADVSIARSIPELLDDPDIAAVHIATPPADHAQLALAALAVGKHTIVEKPIALRSSQAQKIMKVARKNNLVLGVHYPLRYNPLLQAFRTLIAQKSFGNLLWVRLENAAPQPPEGHWFWDMKQSGGIHVEHSVHFFDAALWLVNKKPTNCTGNLVFRQQKNTEAFATITFRGQTLARFAHGFLTVPYIRSTSWLLVWERARARIEGWTPIQAEIVAQALPEEISLLQKLNFATQAGEGENIIRATQIIAAVEDPPYAKAIQSFWQDVATAAQKKSAQVIPQDTDPAISVALAERASQNHLRFPG